MQKRKNGLTLLLLFAYGALKERACGTMSFLKIIDDYLKGKSDFCIARQEIIKRIPAELTTAWPILVKIGLKLRKNPLSEPVVVHYILDLPHASIHTHNALVGRSSPCAVFKGKVAAIEKKKTGEIIFLAKPRGGKIQKIIALPNYGAAITINDIIAWHRGYFITAVP